MQSPLKRRLRVEAPGTRRRRLDVKKAGSLILNLGETRPSGWTRAILA